MCIFITLKSLMKFLAMTLAFPNIFREMLGEGGGWGGVGAAVPHLNAKWAVKQNLFVFSPPCTKPRTAVLLAGWHGRGCVFHAALYDANVARRRTQPGPGLRLHASPRLKWFSHRCSHGGAARGQDRRLHLSNDPFKEHLYSLYIQHIYIYIN